MNVEGIMTLIVKRLHELLGIPVISSTMTTERPPYPFLTYTIIAPRINPRGQPVMKREIIGATDGDFEYDIKETAIDQPTFTVSFSIVAGTTVSALEAIHEITDTLKHVLYYELKDVGAVVVTVGNIQDRSLLIVDHYEYRYGFDLTVRTTNETTRIVETIENINIKLEE